MTRIVFALISMLAFLAAAAPNPVAVPPKPPAVPAHLDPQNAPAAKLKFEEPVLDFGKIKSGEVVKLTYKYTNSGDQPIDIINVQPGCGCTTAGEWTKRVEPGQTGSLSIQFNSASFNGPVMKTITVTSNDKVQPVTVLQLKGTIWRPVDVSPSFAVLNVQPDAGTATTKVKIVNNTDEPMSIASAPESSNPSFKAVVSTNIPNKEFQMEISAVPPLAPGSVQSMITVKTTSAQMPVVTVSVWANVQRPIVVMPPQVTLPAAPLSTKVLPTVTIQNNTTNILKLSDPAINLPDVDVTMQEIVAGRAFSITLAFPPGFTLPVGENVALTVNSSLKSDPTIRIPITQLPRPTSASASPTPAPTIILPPPRPTRTLPPRPVGAAPQPPSFPSQPTAAH